MRSGSFPNFCLIPACASQRVPPLLHNGLGRVSHLRGLFRVLSGSLVQMDNHLAEVLLPRVVMGAKTSHGQLLFQVRETFPVRRLSPLHRHGGQGVLFPLGQFPNFRPLGLQAGQFLPRCGKGFLGIFAPLAFLFCFIVGLVHLPRHLGDGGLPGGFRRRVCRSGLAAEFLQLLRQTGAILFSSLDGGVRFAQGIQEPGRRLQHLIKTIQRIFWGGPHTI